MEHCGTDGCWCLVPSFLVPCKHSLGCAEPIAEQDLQESYFQERSRREFCIIISLMYSESM